MEEAAAKWMIRRDRGLSSRDEEALERWLTASSDHQAAWDRALDVWGQFDDPNLPELAVLRQAPQRLRPTWRAWTMIAASLVAAVAVGWWAQNRLPGLTRPAVSRHQVASGARSYVAGPTERATITLEDGSQVTLDSGAEIAASIRGDARTVRLVRGQAYFEVAHDARRPFSLDVKDHRVVDLGTAFAASLKPDRLSIVLASGRVSIAGPKGLGGEVDLSPGQAFTARTGQAGTVTKVDLEAALAWREGFLQFRETPLRDALVDMQAYDGRRVEIGDHRVGDLRVSGRFKIGDTERFAHTLAEMYPLRVVQVSGGLRLEAARPEQSK
ncbi:MAG: FecR domain-containing protein [Caulobacter sp.]|nr:FecR domain-containing protein [Caulobacter sp.]